MYGGSSNQTSDVVIAALNESDADEISVKRFVELWPLIEALLQTLSIAAELPIAALLNGFEIYRAPVQSSPSCATGTKRSRKLDIGHGAKFSIAFVGPDATQSESDLQASLPFESQDSYSLDPDNIVADSPVVLEFDERLSALADSLLDVVQQLLQDNIVRPTLFNNMAHEISIIFLGMGFLSEQMNSQMDGLDEILGEGGSLESLVFTQSSIRKECQLGLYTIRNFLSYTTERQYEKATRSHFIPLDLHMILKDMIWLHESHAAKKGISFDVEKLKELPQVRGEEMEIRRVFHNVLNNAIKYSYHSTPSARRTIRIRSRIPFDPGFKKRRFSISVESLGVGLTAGEEQQVFRAGFRGRQAVSEVAVGSGIGLSEALKIMKAHRGEIRFRSNRLHGDAYSGTNLTTVDLIFPFS